MRAQYGGFNHTQGVSLALGVRGGNCQCGSVVTICTLATTSFKMAVLLGMSPGNMCSVIQFFKKQLFFFTLLKEQHVFLSGKSENAETPKRRK